MVGQHGAEKADRHLSTQDRCDAGYGVDLHWTVSGQATRINPELPNEGTKPITRLPPTTAMYILVQCYCGISLPLIPITRLPPTTTRRKGTTKYARGLLYFTNDHVHNREGFNRMSNGWKQALRDSIYRSKERHTWTRSTNEISLTKDKVKRQDSIIDDSGERKQYSKTGIFGRIYQHSTTREQKAQPPPYNYIWQQQTIKEYAKTSHPSSS